MIASLIVASFVAHSNGRSSLPPSSSTSRPSPTCPDADARHEYGKVALEPAAIANIPPFNIANALGGLIGRAIVDSSFGASAIPFATAVVPALALLFILSQECGGSVAPYLYPL
jgi:DHA1 family inner membrane transport protein